MTALHFRDLLLEQPFKPFRVIMNNGQCYEVRHPEAAFITQTDLVVGTDLEDDGLPVNFKICSLLKISEVKPLPSTTA